jgi:hypothetical protein
MLGPRYLETKVIIYTDRDGKYNDVACGIWQAPCQWLVATIRTAKGSFEYSTSTCCKSEVKSSWWFFDSILGISSGLMITAKLFFSLSFLNVHSARGSRGPFLCFSNKNSVTSFFALHQSKRASSPFEVIWDIARGNNNATVNAEDNRSAIDLVNLDWRLPRHR